MMWRSSLLADVDRREWNRSLRRSTFLLFVFVAAGSLLGAWLLPRPPTPANVARSYLQAMFHRDWEEAWSLTCQHRRSTYRDFRTFAEQSDEAFSGHEVPKGIDIIARTVDGERGAAAVSITVRDREGGPWHYLGHMSVVVDHGKVRACPTSGPRAE